MTHPLSAACQDVSSGGTIVRVCVCVCVRVLVGSCWSLLVLLLVRMTHPLSAACQDVSSFVRWTTLCVCVHFDYATVSYVSDTRKNNNALFLLEQMPQFIELTNPGQATR